MNPFVADFKKFVLKFKAPMGTSRGVLLTRPTWIIGLKNSKEQARIGLGECAPLVGLSYDDSPEFEAQLAEVCHLLNGGTHSQELPLVEWPAIRFGLEAALLDFEYGGRRLLFTTDFTHGKRGLPINGLVVMGELDAMRKQAFEKIGLGFDCIKIKVGAHDFEAECELLRELRKHHPPDEVQLRLDANGAFDVDSALEKLQTLSQFHVHSLEQPIRAGQRQAMAEICRRSPIAIALDEELIGVHSKAEKHELLSSVKPQYIILKPSLLGGLKASQEWIDLARRLGIGYWVTSALESNIGLNIISQWTSSLPTDMHQGLGTGQLFEHNFDSPLRLQPGHLHYAADTGWPQLNSLADLTLT